MKRDDTCTKLRDFHIYKLFEFNVDTPLGTTAKTLRAVDAAMNECRVAMSSKFEDTIINSRLNYK